MERCPRRAPASADCTANNVTAATISGWATVEEGLVTLPQPIIAPTPPAITPPPPTDKVDFKTRLPSQCLRTAPKLAA